MVCCNQYCLSYNSVAAKTDGDAKEEIRKTTEKGRRDKAVAFVALSVT